MPISVDEIRAFKSAARRAAYERTGNVYRMTIRATPENNLEVVELWNYPGDNLTLEQFEKHGDGDKPNGALA